MALMPRSQNARGRGRSKADAPHPVDIHVGMRVRERRIGLGIGQERLARELGITFQQVQKYESGANRVSASRLFRIAKVLQVKPSFLFEGYEGGRGGRRFAAPPAEEADADHMRRQEAIELVKGFWSIQDPVLRDNLMRLARSFAARGKLK